MKQYLNKKHCIRSLVISVMALCSINAQAILMKHNYANDRLPMYIYTVNGSGLCEYKDEYLLVNHVFSKSESNVTPSVRIGIDDDANTKYCIRTMYSTTQSNKDCKIGPISNASSNCTITFFKPEGNGQTPGVIMAESDFRGCPLPENHKVDCEFE